MVHPSYLLISNMADRMLLSLTGVLISVYTLHVEVETERNPRYRAACDFSENVSCTKVLTSKYARGFGFVGKLLGTNHILNVRNCNLGLLFYLTLPVIDMIFSPWSAAQVLVVLSVAGLLTSFYLAFILFVVLRDVCIVCVTTYLLNGLLLYLSYSYYTALTPSAV